MSDEDSAQRKFYLEPLQEQDDVTMLALKHLLKERELPDLENFICHALNTILENNRTVAFGLTRNMGMTTGSSLRNLLENWANFAYILKNPSKKEDYATKITQASFKYAETLNHLVNRKVTMTDLRKLPSWTTSTITQRVKTLGEGAEFQYVLLSRYTHTDMWAAINDEMVAKDKFWTSLLGWGLEFSMETLLLVKTECNLPDEIDGRIDNLNKKLVNAFASP